MRIITSLAMTLVLVLSSFGLASARGQAHPVESIVICVGQGVQVVHLDADGNPTGPAHICPDGLFAQSALTELAVTLPSVPAVASRVAVMRSAVFVPGPVRITAQARAPPVLL